MNLTSLKNSWRRTASLTVKETRQLMRDKSSIAMGLLLPLLLIFIFGYGISLDLTDAKVAVFNQSPGKVTNAIVEGFRGSPYITPFPVKSMKEAETLFDDGKVRGIVVFPQNFQADLMNQKAKIQIIVYGIDTTSANSLQNYVQQSVLISLNKLGMQNSTPIVMEQRLWYNAANSSTWYFVPGIIAIVLTLVGTFLTALVIAREWERGTMEMLFSTPVTTTEILLSKIIPYFLLGLGGFIITLEAALLVFKVPMEGSFFVILVSSILYLLTSLGIGLLISGGLKAQFLACQIALLVSFLPSVLLSGFVFDLRNVPDFIAGVAYALPPTYFIELLRGAFLSGDNWTVIWKDWAILFLYLTVFFYLTNKTLKKTLEKK